MESAKDCVLNNAELRAKLVSFIPDDWLQLCRLERIDSRFRSTALSSPSWRRAEELTVARSTERLFRVNQVDNLKSFDSVVSLVQWVLDRAHNVTRVDLSCPWGAHRPFVKQQTEPLLNLVLQRTSELTALRLSEQFAFDDASILLLTKNIASLQVLELEGGGASVRKPSSAITSDPFDHWAQVELLTEKLGQMPALRCLVEMVQQFVSLHTLRLAAVSVDGAFLRSLPRLETFEELEECKLLRLREGLNGLDTLRSLSLVKRRAVFLTMQDYQQHAHSDGSDGGFTEMHQPPPQLTGLERLCISQFYVSQNTALSERLLTQLINCCPSLASLVIKANRQNPTGICGSVMSYAFGWLRQPQTDQGQQSVDVELWFPTGLPNPVGDFPLMEKLKLECMAWGSHVFGDDRMDNQDTSNKMLQFHVGRRTVNVLFDEV